jgi:sortase A
MRDKRPVDELSIEELERILAIRKREERMHKLKRMERSGRIVAAEPAPPAPTLPATFPFQNVSAAPPPAAPPPHRVPGMMPAGASPEFEDEGELSIDPGQHAEKKRFWRSFTNQTLFLVEAVALVGIVFVGYQMFVATNVLQEETANAQQLANEQRLAGIPTLQPTPQITLSEIVLPGGHVITETGEALFNFEEVPESLRSLVATQILSPIISRPLPTSETALEITIPRLNVEQTIVQGTDWEALKLGIGQLTNGVSPGDAAGNLVLSGHNDIYSEIFRYLEELEPGDLFYVRTQTQQHTYRVTEEHIVQPDDVWVLQPRAGAVATLISCYPYRVSDRRYVIFAERIDGSV